MPGGRVNDGLGDVYVMLGVVCFFKCEGFAVLLICCLYLFSSLNLFLLVFMVVAYFMSPLRKLLDVSFN